MKYLLLLAISGVAFAQCPVQTINLNAPIQSNAALLNTNFQCLSIAKINIWSGSGVPGVVPGSQFGDFYINTLPATPTAYQCFQIGGCTAVATGNWQLAGSGGGGGSGQAAVYTPVSFSATPTFTASSNTENSWEITLTGNVTGSVLASSAAGQALNFKICQDATGGRTFAWPSGFSTAMTVSGFASACSTQSFFWDGSNAVPLAPGAVDSGPWVVPESAAPGTSSTPPVTLEYAWWDSTGHFPRVKNSAGTIFQMSKELVVGNIRKAGGVNAVDAAAAAADIVALFSTCSGTQYLGADGACHTPSAGGSATVGYLAVTASGYTSNAGVIVASSANFGLIYEPINPSPHSSTNIVYQVQTGASGAALQIGFYACSGTPCSALTSAPPLCLSTVAAGNVASAATFSATWASGSAVTSGVCSPPGDYRIVLTSDSPAVKLLSNYDVGVCGALIGSQVVGASTANINAANSSAAISTGSGSALALNTNLSSITWSPWGYPGSGCGTNVVPILAIY